MTQPDSRDVTPEIPMLERRRIEAQVLGQVYAVMKDRLGRDEARELLRRAVSASAIAQGRAMATGFDHAPTLGDFAGLMQHWTRGGAMDITTHQAEPDRLRFDVTRCGYAQMYRDMGLAEIGDILSCTRDGDFCIGFNPDIELTRTQTIMSGASHCDFCYQMTPPADADNPGNGRRG